VFRKLLTASSWGELTFDQLDVIDADERLSFIANEVLAAMSDEISEGDNDAAS
jgi:hypothetical protein